jgi:hypothetical protein
LFRAHRVIVGSWSRWLRSLLSDGPEEEVVCLDMFTPDAFGSILDYMYGKPFQFSVDVSETRRRKCLSVTRPACSVT